MTVLESVVIEIIVTGCMLHFYFVVHFCSFYYFTYSNVYILFKQNELTYNKRTFLVAS